MKSRNGSFIHIPAPLSRQPCLWEEALRKSYLPVLFHRAEEQQGFSGSPACPKKAVWMEQFVLGDVDAAGEGGMWLQGGSRWP